MIDWDELSKRLFPVDSWVWRSWNHKLRILDFRNGQVNQSDFECDVDFDDIDSIVHALLCETCLHP